MYSDADLEAAVAAGVLDAKAAQNLRSYVADQQKAPAVDEERFRLLTGFNDIFVSIAILLILSAITWLGSQTVAALGATAMLAVSWMLAEFFTRRRKMALPSIVLLVSFIGSCGALAVTLLHPWVHGEGTSAAAIFGSAATLAAGVGAYAHWRRFMVPITPALGAITGLGLVVGLSLLAVPSLENHLMPLLFAGGLVMFGLAMKWDRSDLTRTTRRTDVAFWLHLCAAPLIVHPVFAMIGLTASDFGDDFSSTADLPAAVFGVGVYCALALVALAIDRRALLVSALIYVLVAMSMLFHAAGGVGASFALTALVIGSALLLLSAFWHGARKIVLSGLPNPWQQQLPAV
jgi:hypothetical protein